MRLKELRLERGLTQEQVAKMLGVRQNTYSKYERNKIQMPYSTMFMLADILYTSIDYMLEYEKAAPKIHA